MYEDNPQKLVCDKWQHYYYGDNSYGRSTLGPEENIKAFTQDMLFAHKDALYSKDNLVVTVAGNILNQQDLEDQIGVVFGRLPVKKTMEKPSFLHTPPADHTGFYDKGTEQNHLIIAAQGIAGTDDSKYAAIVLATIL